MTCSQWSTHYVYFSLDNAQVQAKYGLETGMHVCENHLTWLQLCDEIDEVFITSESAKNRYYLKAVRCEFPI